VVTFQYHLAIPSLNLFSVWQLEAMTNYINAHIATAVESVKASLPAPKSSRLTFIEAQADPAEPDPGELPRFNAGLPPSIHDSWSGGYDCGGIFDVDGPSHQSDPTQDELPVEDPIDFCSGTPWIIDADSPIHPSVAGYERYAETLTEVVTESDLVPSLP